MKPWVAMWVYAFTLFFFFKVLSWPRKEKLSIQLLYLFAWPGMDPKVLKRGPRVVAPLAEWAMAIGKTGVGIFLVGVMPRHLPPWAQGWSGMVGLLFILHFGIFHMIALLMKARGFAVAPIMRAPLLATSVSDFWGRRWNMAFRDLAHSNVFSRLSKKYGGPTAIFLTFLFSGLVHEIVISVPVMSGFGGPTLYFVIQGLAMLWERRTSSSRVFTLAVTLLPSPILFHPPFMRGVIVPFLYAVGGLP